MVASLQDHASRNMTWARMLVLSGATVRLGVQLYLTRHLWTRHGASSIAATVVLAGLTIVVAILAIRKPWGVSAVLFTMWCFSPLPVTLALGDELDYAIAALNLLATGLLATGFVVGLKVHRARPDPWRWDERAAPASR